MPRKKQQNPQPVKLDSEDGIAIDVPENLTLDTDFLLGQDLDFGDPDNDNKILGLEKFSEVAAEIGFSVYGLGEEQSPAYSQLSMDSEADNTHSTAASARGDEEVEEDEDSKTAPPEAAFPPYLSCRGCGQLREEPLGPGIDLVGPYCLRCCKASRESKSADYCPFGSMGSLHPGPHDMNSDGAANGLGEKTPADEDGSPKLHSCHLCGFSSRYANHVKRHMKTHNGEKPFNCPLCTYASAQLVNLQRHLRIHTGEKPYKCDSCTFACSSLGNLKRHQRMHVSASAMGHDAERLASGLNNVRRHGTGQRPKEEEPRASSKEVVGRPSSNLALGSQNNDCLSAFDSIKGPPILVAPSHPAAGQQASGGRAAGRPGGGGAAASSSDAGLPPSLFPFTCRLCGAVLEDEDGASAQICAKCTLDMLTREPSSSSPGSPGDKVYTCAACPFLTHYPNHLARHMKTHSGEKPYKCPQCEYASAHFDNLKRHHRVHTGEKPYKCHLCDYACGNLANLKRHQRVHSGAKPFQCAVCSYSCNQSMNLKRHMLRHTGEKPYKCQECGYTTGHWDNYKRHQKKHGLATEGWVKVQMPSNEEEDEEDEEEDEEAMGGGVVIQSQRKEVDMQYMSR